MKKMILMGKACGFKFQGVFMLILNMLSQRIHPRKYRGSMFIP